MGVVLDTSVFIHAERAGESVEFSRLAKYGDVYISAVTVTELLVGMHRAKDTRRRAHRLAYVEAILAQVPVLAFGMEAARVHAEIFAGLLDRGKPIGAHDLIIAATAMAHGCAVATQNVGDFERVPGLDVVPIRG